MTDANPGRLLPACLHQAIADEMPMRLEFYEAWLHPDKLMDGGIGLAPLSAVFGFLRTERHAYDRVMARAGRLAAEWALASTPSFSRRVGGGLFPAIRIRLALRTARRIITDVMPTNRVVARVRRGRVTMHVERSIFCQVRERQAAPLCAFYRALVETTLASFGLEVSAGIESCAAVNGPPCVLLFVMSRTAAAPAMAA